MRPKESVIKGKLKAFLNSLSRLDVWYRCIEDRSQRNIPDILGCCKGRFFSIETKRDKKEEMRYGQEMTMNAIRVAGGLTYRVSSIDELEKLKTDIFLILSERRNDIC